MVTILDLHFQQHAETVAAFLIETANGPALVETGPDSTFSALAEGLKAHGYSPEAIRHVFLTHIHLDHGGAAWKFARMGAIIYVHPLGKPHLEDPSKLLQSARRIYQEDMDRLWGDLQPIPAECMYSVEDRENIHLGDVTFKAIYTPGHAVHHIAWAVGTLLFTGDVAGIRIGKSNMVMPPCPPPDINIGQWLASIEQLKTGRFRSMFLTHFGEVTDIKDHLIQLEGRLLNWANWIKPYFLQEATSDEIKPIFQAYVAKQLEAGGVMGEELIKYENANPSWMSVDGLMRYWKKQANLL